MSSELRSNNHEWLPVGFEPMPPEPDKLDRKRKVKPSKEQRALMRRKRLERRYASGQDYSVGEEVMNAVTHGVGACLAVAAIPLSVVTAVSHGGGVALLCALVYTIVMMCEYVVSTLYHAIQPLRAKRVFRILDHSFIYLYIAACYMPYCLITLGGVGGPYLCAFVWAVALVGVAFEAFWVTRPRWVSAVIYVALGWSVVVFSPQLYALLAPAGFWLLVAGGISYTVGAVFYAVTKKVRFMHSVFHVFVLGGSVCQFLSILLFAL